MGAEHKTRKVSGHVEIDGACFGGYVKPKNHKDDRVDLRKKAHHTGKRRRVMVMLERGGKTPPFVCDHESDSLGEIVRRVEPGTSLYADEASCWDAMHGRLTTQRINHSVSYSDEGVCTNQAKSYFSRLRRAEIGTHHHISGNCLSAYAGEMAWREDYRRVFNGEQFALIVSAALAHSVSQQWKGYWQRSAN